MDATFNVHIWHYSCDMTTLKPIVRKYVETIEWPVAAIVPKNYDERLLDAASNGKELNEEFKEDFRYGNLLGYHVRRSIIEKIGVLANNAARILIEISPGIFSTLSNWFGTLPEGIYSADKITPLKV